MPADDNLYLNPPIPHGALITQGTAAASFSATSAAAYTTGGAEGVTASLAITVPCVVKATVTNLSTSANVFVTVGNTLATPPAPGSSGAGFPLAPGEKYTFQIPGGGTVGRQGLLGCVASAEGASLQICWHQ